MQSQGQCQVDSLAGGFLFSLAIITVLELPVHDLTNHRSGHQAKQLQHAKDGGVQAHCGSLKVLKRREYNQWQKRE